LAEARTEGDRLQRLAAVKALQFNEGD
jgi:hypothetical protein